LDSAHSASCVNLKGYVMSNDLRLVRAIPAKVDNMIPSKATPVRETRVRVDRTKEIPGR
jgi:hypothetical protein